MKKLTLCTLFLAAGLGAWQSHGAEDRARSAEHVYDGWKNKPSEEFSDAENCFKRARQLLLAQYVDSRLSEADLYRAATQGMLSALNGDGGDWNKLITPTELKEMESDLKGEIMGIGVGIKFDDQTGTTQVTDVIAGTAAEKAGLKAGDQIVSVNGRLYKGLQLRDVVYDIRGKAGGKVRLKVLRGDELLSKQLTRERVAWAPVESKILPSSVGVLTIHYFAEPTPALISQALASFKSAKVKGIVIDLRDNSGGLFDKAIEAAREFLPQGSVVVNVVGRDGKPEALRADSQPLAPATPLVLLVDHATASGAELFAGSLSENLGARIVGEPTFGKWSAQTVETLSNRYAIKFTTKRFQTPQGKSYPGHGLTPDVQLDGDGEARLRAAVSLLAGAARG